jgi:hypothetical protein
MSMFILYVVHKSGQLLVYSKPFDDYEIVTLHTLSKSFYTVKSQNPLYNDVERANHGGGRRIGK